MAVIHAMARSSGEKMVMQFERSVLITGMPARHESEVDGNAQQCSDPSTEGHSANWGEVR